VAQQRSSSEDATREREALEDLLKSDGWAVFQRRVLAEWAGEGYFSRMGAAVQSDDPLAAKVVHRVSLEIQRGLQWPVDRVKALRGAA
jgi:hypothetical protein